MIRRPAIRPEAERDIDEIAAFIAKDNLDAALRFYDATQQTFELLLQYPNIGTHRHTANPTLQGLRSYGIRRFRNYLAFFIPLPDGVDIIRVFHAARDHEQWTQQLRE